MPTSLLTVYIEVFEIDGDRNVIEELEVEATTPAQAIRKAGMTAVQKLERQSEEKGTEP